MEGQAKPIFQAWNEVTPQQLVQGEWANPDEKEAALAKLRGGDSTSSSSDITGRSESSSTQAARFKAGTILFAVLDTAVNTDEPSPIMATIVEGPYKGSKLLGTINFAGGTSAESVSLYFNLLNVPDLPSSINVQAVAIDPNTARTSLASSVDHHYLLRYGTLFASSFMSGYSKVITNQGVSQTVATGGGGATTATVTPPLSGRKEIFAALGDVGKSFGSAFSSVTNTPNTIKVSSGTGMGVLILQDVKS